MNKNAKILITGATGFLGSYICKALLKNNYQNLIATCRNSSNYDMLEGIKEKIAWHQIALDDSIAIRDLLSDVDIVIHAAGLVSHLQKDYEALLYTNATLTQFLVDAALEENVSLFVHISSIAALGRFSKNEKINEKSIWRRSKHNSGYAISKYLGEMEVWRGHAEGLPVLVFNPSVILGAGKWEQGSLAIFSKVNQGLIMYPIGSTGWVDVRDCAQNIVKGIQSDIRGERFILNAANKSFKEILQKIAIGINKKPPTKPVTPFLAEIAWRASILLAFFTRKRPIVNKVTARLSQNHYDYSKEKGENLLGLNYRPIEKTIEASSKAFLQSKKDKKEMGMLDF